MSQLERNIVMDKNTEIHKIALALNEDIEELQRIITKKKDLLAALGNVCAHPKVEVYYDRRIGTCEFCLRKFMTHRDVDRIFMD